MPLHFEDHFSSHARGYAAHRPRYPDALVDVLVSQAPSPGTVWEAGCGSGQLSTRLAGRFQRVVATDASGEQLAQAVSRAGLCYVRSQAELAPLAEGCADIAVAAQAAHWFDLDAYWDEVRRVARSGALVALVCYGWHTVGEPAIDARLRRFHDEELAPWWPERRRHVVNGYRELAFPFEELAAPALTMTMEWTLDELLSYLLTWSAVTRMTADVGDEIVQGLARDLAAAWGDRGCRRSVRWPLGLRLGRR